MHNKYKKKVLIISTVGLIYDGITSVILSYLKVMDLTGLEIYVANTIKAESRIVNQIKDLGCEIVELPNRRTNPKGYFVNLVKFIRKKKIEVIHAHGNSGTLAIEMSAGWLGGSKKRIAHSHNTRCDQVKADKLLRPLFYLMYTEALACGDAAGKWLYGGRKFVVLNNGRDVDAFKYNSEIRNIMREKLGITDIAIAHVGGFFEQKNHRFLVEIYREIRKINPNSKLYMIGDGPLRNEIEKLSKDIGVIFTGTTDCVSDYLQAMDGMILPSLFEGLPLVAIEWQINGLPCLFADTITKDCMISDNVQFIGLETEAKEWAEKILELVEQNNRLLNSENAVLNAKKLRFDIREEAIKLKDIYIK